MRAVAQTDWLDVNDVALRYALEGPLEADGPLVVLLHEMGGTLENWDRVVPGLHAAGFRTLRHDLRGSGLSEKIVGGVGIDDLVADTLGLLDALTAPGPVLLVGGALGGAVALACAVAAPERFSGVVAMAPATGAGGQRGSFEEMERAVRANGMRARLLPQVERYFPPLFRTDPEAYRAYRCRIATGDGESYLALSRMLATLDLRPRLAGLSCPTLLVAGAHDRIRPFEAVAELATEIPAARLALVESGHFMSVLTPDLVTTTVLDFWRSIAPASQP